MAAEDFKKDANFIPVIGGVDNSSDQYPTQIRVDSVTKRLLVDAQSVDVGADTIGDGTATITTTASPVQLSGSSVACKRVFVQAHEENTGTVVVGGSTVVAALAGRRGFALFPTQGEWFKTSNLNLLWVDSTQSGDKVHYYLES